MPTEVEADEEPGTEQFWSDRAPKVMKVRVRTQAQCLKKGVKPMKQSLSTKIMAVAILASCVAMAMPQTVQIAKDGRAEDMTKIPPRIGMNQTDLRFMQQAAQGHMFEIQVAQLAIARAQNTWAREFARDLEREHSLGYEELKLLAKDKNVRLPEGISPEQRNHLRRLEGLRGAQFDRAFRQIQTTAHRQSKNTYEFAIKHGSDSMVRGYAVKYLPAINHHQMLMAQNRTMLQDADANVRREIHNQRHRVTPPPQR
jgi:putative membrane protein